MLAYWQLWAKTAANGRWHALPYHLLDVAAAAEALWDRVPSNSRGVALQSLGDEGVARRTCVFLAAAHDIGKANRYFQAKLRCQHERLSGAGADLPPHNPDDKPRHGQATGAHLKPWLADHWGWTDWVAKNVALAVGGHHGSFFRDTNRTHLGVDRACWFDVGRSLLDALAALLIVVKPREPDPLNPFLGWVSGFVSVADWLGSHEFMTVWRTGEMSLADYVCEARHRAAKLLDDLRWQIPPTTMALPLADLVPIERAPNALQQVAAQVAPDFSIAIVEAPTGEGKTEAAFALAEPARSAGGGVYFALPTMATANGLHDRVEAYLRKATRTDDLETRLLHSQAWLFREPAETVPNPGDEGGEQETHAQDWFAGAKRGLLAPFGVGTVDQAMIAALRAKHGFVRLFALAGKTVVIDEVHAYDVYMADLIDVLLGWLRALGCRVILLSATLPKTRRKALLKAWGAPTEHADGEYPAITWVTEQGHVQMRGFDVRPRKPLTFELVSCESNDCWVEGASRILRLVRTKGGLGALVLNTVRDAQNAYDWVRKQDPAGIRLELFHARFTARDRDMIEKRVLGTFGKIGPRTQPTILVATQVVEQSLDLDFDHLVSALAPIDLLIQRAGRLHRHRRARDGRLRDSGVDERPNPVLFVLSPPLGKDGIPDICDPIYSYDILMRSLERLQTSAQIQRPRDVQVAIEAVYGEAKRNETLSAWEKTLKDFESRTAEKTQLQRRQAERATIGKVDDDDCLIVESFLDLDEYDERHASQLRARTRLEEHPSITIALLRNDAGCVRTIYDAEPTNLREVMFACVRVSPPYPLWEALLDIKPRREWTRKGSLSQARPLFLEQGRSSVGGFDVSYDARRGLDWSK